MARVARNGIVPPGKVIDLLPKVFSIREDFGLEVALLTLRRFCRSVPRAGPEIDASELSKSCLEKWLTDLAVYYHQHWYTPDNPYELTKRYAHINLVHKITITPAGIYLGGPEPEPTNRVLRRYAEHADHFVRVVFQDEDGSSVRYDPMASQHTIYHERFKCVLDGGVLVAGRKFSFLGFSHSSLRSQSCWSMAGLFVKNRDKTYTFKLPKQVLQDLGDFTNIRVPAKCAARIGQNFTDT